MYIYIHIAVVGERWWSSKGGVVCIPKEPYEFLYICIHIHTYTNIYIYMYCMDQKRGGGGAEEVQGGKDA